MAYSAVPPPPSLSSFDSCGSCTRAVAAGFTPVTETRRVKGACEFCRTMLCNKCRPLHRCLRDRSMEKEINRPCRKIEDRLAVVVKAWDSETDRLAGRHLPLATCVSCLRREEEGHPDLDGRRENVTLSTCCGLVMVCNLCVPHHHCWEWRRPYSTSNDIPPGQL